MKSLFAKIVVVILILSMTVSLLSACAGGDDPEVTTDVITTETPTTEAPTTEAATEAPTTAATEAPTTEAPTTEAPTTEAPTTEAETEPEISFPGAASPELEKIAKKIATSEKYLIFTIGDSVTQGQGASDPKTKDYTAMFAKKLGEIFTEKSIYRVDGAPNSSYTGIVYPEEAVKVQTGTGNGEITVARCGVGGDTVKRALNRTDDFINKEIRGQTGSLFIICFGINDSFRLDANKYAAPPIYKQQLSDLIDKIYEAHPDADVILMTPTYTNEFGDYSSVLNMYVRYVKDLANSRGVACIDLNAVWMNHLDKSLHNGQGDWLHDGCHPSDIGHEVCADEMIRCLFGIE